MADAPFTVTLVDEGYRASLRTSGTFAGIDGVFLPERIGETTDGDITAFRLGPDEWMLLSAAPIPEPAEGFEGALADISHREVVLRIEGPAARAAIEAGCPRDLRTFGVGRAVRTVFAGVSVILHRAGVDRYDLHVWRSFAPHARHFLDEAEAELSLFPV